MKSVLTILCCRGFVGEVRAAIAAECWTDVEVAHFPVTCGRPPIRWEQLQPLLSERCTHVLVLGRTCLSSMKKRPADALPVRFLAVRECFDIIAEPQIVDRALARHAYIVSPGWMAEWPARLAQLGLHETNAAEVFRDFAKEVNYLDTGTETVSAEELKRFETAVGVPLLRQEVGISQTRSLLREAVGSWRAQLSTDSSASVARESG